MRAIGMDDFDAAPKERAQVSQQLTRTLKQEANTMHQAAKGLGLVKPGIIPPSVIQGLKSISHAVPIASKILGFIGPQGLIAGTAASLAVAYGLDLLVDYLEK